MLFQTKPEESKEKRPQGRPKTHGLAENDKKARAKSMHAMVPRRECANPARRKRLEKDDAKWLKWYCPETFYLPFEKPHFEIQAAARESMLSGKDMAVAAERGVGKSAILYALTFKYAVAGQHLFPVYIPWSEKDRDQGFTFWMDCLTTNRRIIDDYPEICDPFAHADGVAQRINTTTWQDTGKPTGARSKISKGVIVFPDGRGLIGSSTMGGNPRGLNYTFPGGRIVRPTGALVDDIQDDKVAASTGPDGLVAKTIKKINGAIRGLKRAGSDFSLMLTGNCIAKGDVMDHFLNQAGWISVRVSCVDKWPKGWDDLKSECAELWQEWQELFHSGKGEVAFYRQHKSVMTAGMVLNSPKAYYQYAVEKAKDKRQKIGRPVDAFHAVMREYSRMGHEAFMAERQQSPVDPIAQSAPYVLTPETILSRTTKRPPMQMPDWVAAKIASTDINPSYALSTGLIGFGADQTPAVSWYGIHKLDIPGDTTAPELARRLFADLVAHGHELAAMPTRPDLWAIDAGGAQFDAVVRFAAECPKLCGIQAVAFTGRGARNYRPYGKTALPGQRREQCHGCLDRKQGRVIRWVAWNADYWKEAAQRSWLGDIGAPGAATLPAGNHMQFAQQVANEPLLGKAEVGGMMVWNFQRKPGRNDFGDVMAQGFAAAAYSGIGTEGQRKQTARKPQRRVRHVEV